MLSVSISGNEVIPGLQACPGMIEAGGIQWLYGVTLDSCFRRNDVGECTDYYEAAEKHSVYPSTGSGRTERALN